MRYGRKMRLWTSSMVDENEYPSANMKSNARGKLIWTGHLKLAKQSRFVCRKEAERALPTAEPSFANVGKDGYLCVIWAGPYTCVIERSLHLLSGPRSRSPDEGEDLGKRDGGKLYRGRLLSYPISGRLRASHRLGTIRRTPAKVKYIQLYQVFSHGHVWRWDRRTYGVSAMARIPRMSVSLVPRALKHVGPMLS